MGGQGLHFGAGPLVYYVRAMETNLRLFADGEWPLPEWQLAYADQWEPEDLAQMTHQQFVAKVNAGLLKGATVQAIHEQLRNPAAVVRALVGGGTP